jgi:TonB family protein
LPVSRSQTWAYCGKLDLCSEVRRCRVLAVVSLLLPFLAYSYAQPQPLHWEKIEYPIPAVQAGIEGTVILHGRIKPDGSLKSLKVLSGPRALAGAAVSGASKWVFPETPDGGQVVRLLFEFKIRGVTDGRPETKCSFEPPDHLIVTAPRPMVMPSSGQGTHPR